MKSTFERRRNAVGWWLSKATNARFSALALSKSHEPTIASIAKEHGYSRTTSIALDEGFLREASIALELIIKAIIAHELEDKAEGLEAGSVPTTHDLPLLWKTAGLPELSTEDQCRLFLCKTVLIWAGRYPTPKSEALLQQESRTFDKLSGQTRQKGKFFIKKTISFNFEDFDKLFQMAQNRLYTRIS